MQPRLQAPQELASHSSASKAAQVASHTQHQPNIQASPFLAGWPPLNPDLHGLGLQAHGCPSSQPSLTDLAQQSSKVDNHHKTNGTDKQIQPSANPACHKKDEDRNTNHVSSLLANNAIMKPTNPPVFVASDITIGTEPFKYRCQSSP